MKSTIFILICISMIFAKPFLRNDEPLIGGGDHDKRPHGNNSSPFIGGGDHDYKPHGNNSSPFIGGGDHDYRPHGNNSSHHNCSRHRIGGGDHDYRPHGNNSSPFIGGGDHDYRPHGNNSSHHNCSKHKIGGGDHDYKPHGNNSKHNNSSGNIIGGGDHDYKNHTKVPFIIGGDHDYVAYKIRQIKQSLLNKTVEELRQICSRLEAYLVSDSNTTGFVGGYSSLPFANSTTFAKCIIGVVLKRKELLAEEIFSQVAYPDTLQYLQPGGLVDYIFRENRTTLERWALTAEAHDRKMNNITDILGGLDDMIKFMNTSDLIQYIVDAAQKYPELDSGARLDELSLVYGISIPAEPHIIDGGLHDYIFREKRETLIKWALASEKYHRQVNNLRLLGGLDDYIDNLSTEDIVQYILTEASEHDELNSGVKLDNMVQNYNITHVSRAQIE